MNDDHETWSNDGPECPYCGHVQNISDDPEIYYDEDTTELDCERCLKNFQVSVYHSTSWTCNRWEE